MLVNKPFTWKEYQEEDARTKKLQDYLINYLRGKVYNLECDVHFWKTNHEKCYAALQDVQAGVEYWKVKCEKRTLERDEARLLAGKKNEALLSVCKQYCDWYDHGSHADAGNAFYDAKRTAGAAWEPLPWEIKK